MAKKTALLAEGKTDEEVQLAINELLKLDETKVPFYKNAIDMTSSRLDRVKRVVIAVKATETEKVPEAFVEREGHFYLLEYFPAADARGRVASDRDGYRDFGRDGGGRSGGQRDGKGNRGPGGRGGNDRGRPGGRNEGGRGPERAPRDSDREFSRENREPREPRTPRPQPAPNPNAASFVSTGLGTLAPKAPGSEKKEHGARPQRQRKPREGGELSNRGPNRGPGDSRGPKGAGELRLVLKGQSATTLQGSAPAEAPSESQANPAPLT